VGVLSIERVLSRMLLSLRQLRHVQYCCHVDSAVTLLLLLLLLLTSCWRPD
jgi:hypothetical protein